MKELPDDMTKRSVDIVKCTGSCHVIPRLKRYRSGKKFKKQNKISLVTLPTLYHRVTSKLNLKGLIITITRIKVYK